MQENVLANTVKRQGVFLFLKKHALLQLKTLCIQ